jgi:hypothetical protein
MNNSKQNNYIHNKQINTSITGFKHFKSEFTKKTTVETICKYNDAIKNVEHNSGVIDRLLRDFRLEKTNIKVAESLNNDILNNIKENVRALTKEISLITEYYNYTGGPNSIDVDTSSNIDEAKM